MYAGHVALHRPHTTCCVAVMVTRHHHAIMLADMIVQRRVIGGQYSQNGQKAASTLLIPSPHVCSNTVAPSRCADPKGPSGTYGQIHRIIIGDILAIGASHYYHDVDDSHYSPVWKLLRTRYSGQGYQHTLIHTRWYIFRGSGNTGDLPPS